MNNLDRTQDALESYAIFFLLPKAPEYERRLAMTYNPPVVRIDGEKIFAPPRVELVYESRLVLDKYPHPPYWNWVLIDRETYTLE